MFAVPFPVIDPVAIEIGPLAVRWYALAYIAGILLAWRVALRLADRRPDLVTARQIDDFVVWGTLGVVLGGRLGYVLFYKPGYFLANPAEIVMVWRGGMSFHGGMLGVLIAAALFARANRIPFLALGDVLAAVAPIGLFFGRVANFVNGELWGRVSDVPWAMVFPHGGPLPRHPSQLYQASLEGILLFVLVMVLVHRPAVRGRPGIVTGAFLAGYAGARIVGELFREPDSHLGFLALGWTMGQWLSIPMLVAGLALMAWAARQPVRPSPTAA